MFHGEISWDIGNFIAPPGVYTSTPKLLVFLSLREDVIVLEQKIHSFFALVFLTSRKYSKVLFHVSAAILFCGSTLNMLKTGCYLESLSTIPANVVSLASVQSNSTHVTLLFLLLSVIFILHRQKPAIVAIIAN